MKKIKVHITLEYELDQDSLGELVGPSFGVIYDEYDLANEMQYNYLEYIAPLLDNTVLRTPGGPTDWNFYVDVVE